MRIKLGGFVIGAAALFELATMTATITSALAMMGLAGIRPSATVAMPPSTIIADPEPFSGETTENIDVPASLPTSGNDCQTDGNDCRDLKIVATTPAEMAAAYAGQLAEWCAGETYDWSDIQVDYRRFAKQQKWRLEIADRILSKALKDAGCIRGQEDRRKEGKGRPVTITVPWRDE